MCFLNLPRHYSATIFSSTQCCFLYSVCFLHICLFFVQCFFFCTMCFLYSVVFAHCLFSPYLIIFYRIGLVSPVLMLQGSYVMFSHTLSLFYSKKKRKRKKKSIKPPTSHHMPSKKPISTFAHLNQFQNHNLSQSHPPTKS